MTQQNSLFLAHLIVLDRYSGQGGSSPTLPSFRVLGSVHLVVYHPQKVVDIASTHITLEKIWSYGCTQIEWEYGKLVQQSQRLIAFGRQTRSLLQSASLVTKHIHPAPKGEEKSPIQLLNFISISGSQSFLISLDETHEKMLNHQGNANQNHNEFNS